MLTIATNGAAITSHDTESEPMMLKKRIGSTVYAVSVRFSETNRETMRDKLLRVIESKVQLGA